MQLGETGANLLQTELSIHVGRSFSYRPRRYGAPLGLASVGRPMDAVTEAPLLDRAVARYGDGAPAGGGAPGGETRHSPLRVTGQAGTATGFSIGTPTMLPHSVQLPS